MGFLSSIGDFITGGGGSLIGGLVSGVGGLIGAGLTNNANEENATAQRAFEAQQSDTTYQRGTQDLIAAGLNPMLAIAHPDPVATYTPPAFDSGVSSAINSGVGNFSALQSARLTAANIDTAQSQANLNNANVLKAAADTTLSAANAKLTAANTDKITSGSTMSNLLGSTAANKLSGFLNNSLDNIGPKLNDLVSGVTSNSASALSRKTDDFSNLFSFGEYSKPENPQTDSNDAQARDFLINGGM